MNIAKFLLSMERWKEKDGVYLNDEKMLYFIDDMHIYHDNVDEEIENLGYSPDTIIFASRHASAAKKKTLSIHAVGNFSNAEYGGKDATLVLCNPLLMRKALELLNEKSLEEYEVCYEATHHGPYLEKPCFFIEVGSTEKEWGDERACKAIAEVILEIEEKQYEIAIGIGGGHYAPRFTDLALEKDIAFGHIAAKYAVPYLNDGMLRKMIEATPGCKRVYFHGEYKEIKEILKRIDVEISDK
jgi:D-aminoacyl-tRNA deacylase